MEQQRSDSSEHLRPLKSGVITYALAQLRTIRYFYTDPDKLLQNVLDPCTNSGIVPPIQLLSTSIVLFYAAAKVVGFGDGEFELPPAVGYTIKILNGTLIDANRLFMLYSLSSVLIACLLLWSFRLPVRIWPAIRIAAYCPAAMSITLTLILIIPALVWGTKLRFTVAYRTTAWFILVPFAAYAWYWTCTSLHRAFHIPKSAVMASLVAGCVFSALPEILGLEPIEHFYIRGGSMSPTFDKGDVVIVNKWVYSWRAPRRGEIVVFWLKLCPVCEVLPSVGRIVGLPGDALQYKFGELFLNDRRLPLEEVGAYTYTENGISFNQKRYVEYVAPGTGYTITKATQQGFMNNCGPFNVPEGAFFVLGDNRDNSVDSRLMRNGIGYVPAANVIGKAYGRLFPLNKPLHAGLYAPES